MSEKNKVIEYTIKELKLLPVKFSIFRSIAIDTINTQIGVISDKEMKELILSFLDERIVVSYTRELLSKIISVVTLVVFVFTFSHNIFSWCLFGASFLIFILSKYFNYSFNKNIRERNFTENLLTIDEENTIKYNNIFEKINELKSKKLSKLEKVELIKLKNDYIKYLEKEKNGDKIANEIKEKSIKRLKRFELLKKIVSFGIW